MEEVQSATAPSQHAMSTRGGCECIFHALHGLTEMNARATVMSIDGISAYDCRVSMICLVGVHSACVDVSRRFPLFVGGVHGKGAHNTARRRRRTRRCNAFALLPWPPLSLGRVQSQLEEGEVLMAFLVDTNTVSMPDRVHEVHTLLEGLCGPRRGSECTKVRRKCGIWVRNPQGATIWKWRP